MLILNQSQVRATMGMRETIPVVARACAEYAAGRADIPLRTHLALTDRGGITLWMPGYLPGFRALGNKIIAEFPANDARGLPVLTGVFTLLDDETGLALGVMDALHLTNLRTAGLTGVAAQRLAPPGSRVAAVLGTGGLAPAQVWALSEALPLSEIRVWGRRPERARAVAEQVQRDGWAGAAQVHPVDDAEQAVRGADVVVTATSARTPILEAEWVREGALVCAMGSHDPQMQELPTALVARAQKVFADSREGVLGRAGDVLIPIEAGVLSRETVWELGHLVSGDRPGRERADETILFKSCGFAALDLAVGSEVYRQARSAHVGFEVDLLA